MFGIGAFAGHINLVEDQPAEVVQVVLPVAGIMSVVVDIPEVRNLMVAKEPLSFLADTQQLIFRAAGKPDQVELVSSLFGGGNQTFRRVGIGRGREARDPAEFFGVPESEIQGLPTAHGESRDGSVVTIGQH
jgi:hypothetical protein